MKKIKLIATTMASLALVFTSVSPALASAESINLGGNLHVSTRVDVSKGNDHEGDDDFVKAGLNANTNVNTNATVTPRMSHDDKNKNNDNDQDETHNKNNASSTVQLPKGIVKRIEDGKGVPPGWWGWFQRMFSHGTTTVDVTAPAISKVEVTEATSSAMVMWTTKESTTGVVKYGTSTPVNASSSAIVDSILTMNHSVNLTGLSADTTYYFTITAKDSAGNTKTTDVRKFHTDKVVVPAPDVTVPVISFSTAFLTTASSTHIFWATNEKSDSRVWLSTTSPVGISGTSTLSLSGMVLYHNVKLTGLASSTLYYYAVESVDASGNASAATTGSFTTPAM